jgi:hypothetical protein
MLYVTDGVSNRTFGKLISGDTLKEVCPRRVLTVAELVELECGT